ncbi:PREDICTED: laccase-2-like [Nicrophorus vespilloides]|uniref:Laccase-2-like n=1 Tax=Nicrophorus vespilloides TaxID=110193 RepID=A0ABM1N9H3_NICVS|nr:PREDICTED: laccase-2-like [Nicrophorus vespilloides]
MLSNEQSCLGCEFGNYTDCLSRECVIADGNNRIIEVYNKMMPGPSIEVCEGDQIIVDFTNNLLDVDSTIHWHGMHQRGTQFMDGISFVSHCAIIPRTTFRYSFNASQVGTHWYHSHSSVQRSNGAYGALIIRRPTFQRTFDLSEHIVIINDWFKDLPITHLYKQVRNKKIYTDLISSILVNGFGSTVNNTIPPKRFFVKQGFRYRFRIIHAGGETCPIKINIDNHSFYVVSTDGNDIIPILTDSVSISNGERFDIVVETNQRISSYAIRFTGSILCSFSAVAALVYDGAKTATVSYEYDALNPDFVGVANPNMPRKAPNVYSYTDLRSTTRIPRDLTGSPDFQYYVAFKVEPLGYNTTSGFNSTGIISAHFNNIVMEIPSTPLLLNPNPSNVCSSKDSPNCDKDLNICECVHIVEFPYNGLIEVVYVDEGQGTTLVHSMHLHGYHFYVIGQDKLGARTTAEQVKELDRKGLLYRNFNRPIIKDTVAVADGGYTIVRFRADNPGFWLMHCHVDFHSVLGMMMVFKTGDLNVPIPHNFPTCGNYP